MSSNQSPSDSTSVKEPSRWSMDTNDYHMHAQLHRELYPPPPPKAHLRFKRSKQSLDKSYNIGDPFFFDDSLEPYMFLGGRTLYNNEGQARYEAEFMVPTPQYPPRSIKLKLHHRIERDRIRFPPRLLSRDWFREKLGYICCI
jgi:hypothetical protein